MSFMCLLSQVSIHTCTAATARDQRLEQGSRDRGLCRSAPPQVQHAVVHKRERDGLSATANVREADVAHVGKCGNATSGVFRGRLTRSLPPACRECKQEGVIGGGQRQWVARRERNEG